MDVRKIHGLPPEANTACEPSNFKANNGSLSQKNHTKCFRTMVSVLWGLGTLVNPHQRCGYSDSPFARKDTFLYCRVQKWVEEGRRRARAHEKKLYLRKRQFFVMEKYIEDVKQDEKTRPGSAGIGNETHLSCKRKDMKDVVQSGSI